MSGNPFIELRGVSANYGQIEVLKDIHIKVNQGETVALIGSNGAGKSTLLKTISGLIRPTKGEIWFDGAPIHQITTHRIVQSGLVHIPEGRAILKQMSIEDNLLTGAMFVGKFDSKRQLQQMYKMFPILDERKKLPAGTLSGGQQQMLAIARGLMGKPRLLMLDEPSLGLAPIMIKEIFTIIRNLKQEGITILLVEQNAKQALRIADRGYVLENGKIIMSDYAEALLNNESIADAYLGGTNRGVGQ